MTDHRTTDQIIDAIDHCLDDFTVSGDAMRYAPEPPLADWERALTAHPFDPDHPALRGFSMQETRRGQVVWELYPDEPSDAAEPESIQPNHEHVPVSIGFDAGRGVHVVPILARGWGRQAALDRAVQEQQVREQLVELGEAVGVAVGRFVEWAEQAAAAMGLTLTAWQRQVAAMVDALRPAMPDLPGLSIDGQDVEQERAVVHVHGEDQVVAGVHARAINHVRNRNTGPSRDRTRQRRPRTHQ